ncbi:hypothetical protein N665_0107s0001 [Sinapis alba]|nr:hypothetical protein N665_0107s0001 [Sinapis alba]
MILWKQGWRIQLPMVLKQTGFHFCEDAIDFPTNFEYIFSCSFFDCVEESIGSFMYTNGNDYFSNISY